MVGENAERDLQMGPACIHVLRQENEGVAPHMIGLPFQEVPPKKGQTWDTGSLTKRVPSLTKNEGQKKLTPEQIRCQERDRK